MSIATTTSPRCGCGPRCARDRGPPGDRSSDFTPPSTQQADHAQPTTPTLASTDRSSPRPGPGSSFRPSAAKSLPRLRPSLVEESSADVSPAHPPSRCRNRTPAATSAKSPRIPVRTRTQGTPAATARDTLLATTGSLPALATVVVVAVGAAYPRFRERRRAPIRDPGPTPGPAKFGSRGPRLTGSAPASRGTRAQWMARLPQDRGRIWRPASGAR